MSISPLENRIILVCAYFFSVTSTHFAGTGSEEEISLSFKNVSLRTALNSLARQTRFDIVYDATLVKKTKITCHMKNIPLYLALERLLRDTSISFQVFEDHQIVFLQRATANKKRVTLYGRVFAEESGQPLESVNVFLANTMMGSATDEDGLFIIPRVPLGTFDLVVSRLGYGVHIRKLIVTDTNYDPLVIPLTPKPFQAPEIEVSAKALQEWHKNLDKFTKLFFSTTENAAECKILNPTVLDFSQRDGLFLVTAHEPLLIENQALGYKLHYVMEFFSASRTMIRMRGFSRFEELKPQSPEVTQRWKQNRLRAYRGSLKHFLATLCRNGQRLITLPTQEIIVNNAFLNQSGFEIFLAQDPWQEEERVPVHDANILLHPAQYAHQQLLSFPMFLMVHYTREGADKKYHNFGVKSGLPNEQVSLITLTADSVVIDTYGNIYDSHGLRVDGFGLRTYGYWSWERMADRLPWDYMQSSTPANSRAAMGKRN